MNTFTPIDIIYGGRNLLTGTPLAELHEQGFFDVTCTKPTDIKDRLAEFLEALNTLAAEDIYCAAYDLCGYSHFELEGQGQPLPSSKTDLYDYKLKFEGTEHWPEFIQNLKTALLGQRLAELKDEVYNHARNLYNAGVIKREHTMTELLDISAAVRKSVDALTLENIDTA